MLLRSNNPETTQLIGEAIGKLLEPGDVVSLEGPLGAGKTCMAQGVAKGLGVDDYITSPSFVFVHEHFGRLPLYHVDAYRINTADEVLEIGCEEYFYGDGVTIVEWGDKIEQVLPKEHLKIRIKQIDDERQIELLGSGEKFKKLVEELTKCLC